MVRAFEMAGLRISTRLLEIISNRFGGKWHRRPKEPAISGRCVTRLRLKTYCRPYKIEGVYVGADGSRRRDQRKGIDEALLPYYRSQARASASDFRAETDGHWRAGNSFCTLEKGDRSPPRVPGINPQMVVPA